MSTLMMRRPGSILNLLDNFNHSNWFDHWEDDWDYTIPAVNIREENDRYVLEAELPGLEEKDVKLSVEHSQLTIRGERVEEKKNEKKDKYLIRERRAAKFERSFTLSDKIDTEHIDATFKNGILTIVAHKKPTAKPATIKIKAA